MSTRSCIARIKGDGFEGVYHHWDGYPTALGKTLWDLAHARPDNDVGEATKQMLRLLIDRHPAGWSSINGDVDWSQEPGFREGGFDNGRGPECYCHGGRHEEAQAITQDDDMGMEWAYVFDENAPTMTVLERVRSDGKSAIGFFGTLGTDPETGERNDAWSIRGVFYLNGPEPDWKLVSD